MNRHERRAARRRKAKVGGLLEISLGRCLMEKGNDPVLQCFVCGGAAATWPWPDGPEKLAYGWISINGSDIRLICEACFNDPDTIGPKLWGAPDMVVEDGGEASLEEIREIAVAMRERNDSNVH
jgi:hypothetical protein